MAEESIKERQVIHQVPGLPGWAVVREFERWDTGHFAKICGIIPWYIRTRKS